MMKETLRALETGALAEIGLIAFVVAFVTILVRVAVLTRSERRYARDLPLDEPQETYPEENAIKTARP